MRITSIFGLPASLLILVSSHTASTKAVQDEVSPAQWELPAQAKRWQEGTNRRREVEEHLRLGRSPVGVMKMNPDAGEKFYMEYWQFEQDMAQSPDSPLRPRNEDEEARLLANGSAAISFRPPFALHTEYVGLKARGLTDGAAVLAVLKRGFVCPTGTADCGAIGYPNSCCSTDESCFAIQDTGLGPVGCCPKGGSCGGTITSCNAPNSPCADNLGGGCCIPNYVCEGVGCKY